MLHLLSFVSEPLVQSLCIPRVRQNIRVSGIAGSTPRSPVRLPESWISEGDIGEVQSNGTGEMGRSQVTFGTTIAVMSIFFPL